MENNSRLIWQQRYSANIEFLDAQHKKLFSIINQNISILENKSEKYLPVFKGLIDYLSVDFHEEHLVMMETQFPDISKHIREHMRFTEKISQLLNDYADGDVNLGARLNNELKNWIREHALGMDLKLGEFLTSHPEKLKKAEQYIKKFEKTPYLYVVNG